MTEPRTAVRAVLLPERGFHGPSCGFVEWTPPKPCDCGLEWWLNKVQAEARAAAEVEVAAEKAGRLRAQAWGTDQHIALMAAEAQIAGLLRCVSWQPQNKRWLVKPGMGQAFSDAVAIIVSARAADTTALRAATDALTDTLNRSARSILATKDPEPQPPPVDESLISEQTQR